MKVFLGGTCNGKDWRNEVIKKIKCDYFNPIVDDWTEEAKKNEVIQKEVCDVHIYVINKEMTGVFSIAEMVQDCCHKITTIIFIDYEGFTESQKRSLKAVENLCKTENGIIVDSLDDVCNIINLLNDDSFNNNDKIINLESNNNLNLLFNK